MPQQGEVSLSQTKESKLIERAIAKQISDHLTNGNLFDPRQYAYRRYHSRETALLHILDFAYSANIYK
jgi:hypothetical protein